MLNQQGFFVTVDGPNGVGKSSTVIRVAQLLRDAGMQVLQTKEPTPRFRRESEELRGAKLASLIVEDRRLHLEEEIVPSLQSGMTVICDRYIESSLVYCDLDGTSMKETWLDHCQFRRPDLRFLMIASVAALEARLAGRSSHSRFEREFSREAELNSYLAAHRFLDEAGIVSIIVDNTVTSTEQTAAAIVRLIMEKVV